MLSQPGMNFPTCSHEWRIRKKILAAMVKTYRCEVNEGSATCAFMPTSLDSRCHKRLRFNAKASDKEGNTSVITSSHPQNSEIVVEGTKIHPASSKYVVGIVDDASGRIELVDADVFSVHTMVRLSAMTEDTTSTGGLQAYLDKKKELINTYAPVKKQRQLRASVNSIVSDEKIEGFMESMNTMRDALKEEDKHVTSEVPNSQSGVLAQMRELLPPFSLEATTPGEIYDFGAVFGESLMSSIGDFLADESTVSGYIYKCVSSGHISTNVEGMEEVHKLQTFQQLHRLFTAHKHDKKKNMAKLLSILVSMIFLFKEKRKKNWTSFDIYSSSEVLTERLAELYSIGGIVDRECTQKLLAHICLFILRLTPFWEFDFGDLKTDLNIQAKELIATMTFAGINFKTGGYLGRLKAPLVVQTPYQGGKRNNRQR
jgi:hypothetical protein